MIHGAVIKSTTGEISMRLYNVYQIHQERITCKLIEDSLKKHERLLYCQPLDTTIHMVGDMIELGHYENWCVEFIKQICKEFFLDEKLLRSTYRGRTYTDFRFICFYVIRENTPLTLKEIGGMFNKRDHSTVINGLRKYKALSDTDVEFKFKAEKCKSIFFKIKSNHNG